VPLIATNGVSLNAVEMGEGSPVVMLHGLLVGSSASWYFTCAPALAHDLRVLLYDLRGHGRSSRAGRGYDAATLGGDLSGLLDVVGWTGRISLVGHSYGALVALHWALAHPERVERLALVELPLPPHQLPELEAFFSLEPSQMAEALPAAMRLSLERRGRQAEKLLAKLLHLALETSALADVRAERDIPDATLATLRCAPLLVFGDQSPCRGVGERLVHVIPDSRLVLLPGGHYLPLDAPEMLTAALQGYFLGGDDRVPR
jgi:pimeloyl-ACP methyl ester carboxylesterase